jgi:hypothetical protein
VWVWNKKKQNNLMPFETLPIISLKIFKVNYERVIIFTLGVQAQLSIELQTYELKCDHWTIGVPPINVKVTGKMNPIQYYKIITVCSFITSHTLNQFWWFFWIERWAYIFSTLHTYIPLTLYPRRSSRGTSDIPPRHVLPKLGSYEKHCRRDRW